VVELSWNKYTSSTEHAVYFLCLNIRDGTDAGEIRTILYSILDGFDDFGDLSMRHATLVTAGSPQTIPTTVN